MIILDSEKEPLEEDDGSMELNPDQVMKSRIAIAGHLVPSFIMRTSQL